MWLIGSRATLLAVLASIVLLVVGWTAAMDESSTTVDNLGRSKRSELRHRPHALRLVEHLGDDQFG